ncbi:MAG: SIMPL domain-containing protein [Pseudomonadota bacterium]|nr:SIMPL domain-containing protein [Pseudomonadota bacterium]
MPQPTLIRRLVLVSAIGAGLACATATSAQVAPTSPSPTPPPTSRVGADQSTGTLLSVSAQGEARRVPDVARISAGVVTQAADANAAMRANAEQMTRVIDAIKRAGIAARDVQTSGINLNPQYRYGENQPPVITGYQTSNTVELTVRELDRLGAILDALVSVGANQINGPRLEVEDTVAAYDEARRAALDKAQQRAGMYAKSLGMQVRRIVSISEGGGMGPPMPMMAMARMEKASDTSVSPGENTLSANLDVVFELER